MVSLGRCDVPRLMSFTESSPPYEPSHPETASTSTPKEMRTRFGAIVYFCVEEVLLEVGKVNKCAGYCTEG
jgi:hypothetical protein